MTTQMLLFLVMMMLTPTHVQSSASSAEMLTNVRLNHRWKPPEEDDVDDDDDEGDDDDNYEDDDDDDVDLLLELHTAGQGVPKCMKVKMSWGRTPKIGYYTSHCKRNWDFPAKLWRRAIFEVLGLFRG